MIAHDRVLQASRVALLESRGYTVESVDSDDEAMAMLHIGRFDLVLVGRRSEIPKVGIDQRLRESYPEMLILKIDPGGEHSLYASRSTDSQPQDVLKAIREMLQ